MFTTLAIQNITNGTNGFDAQTIKDPTDDAAIAASEDGNGVVTGCQVAAQSSPNMTVQVAAGTILVNGAYVAVSAVSSLSIVAADSTDRRDIVVVNSSGTVSVTKGTDCGTAGWTRSSSGLGPIKPAIPSNSVILAEVYVSSTTTSIPAINIVDKTTLVAASPGTLLARAQNAPSSATTYTPVVITTGVTALDTTNLKVTFIVPPSGTVKVNLQAMCHGLTAAAKTIYFAVVSSTGSPGTLVGVSGAVYLNPTSTTGDDYQISSMSQIITSLSAGSSITWYFAAGATTAADAAIIAQGGATNTATPTGAPALIEVYAA